MTFLRINSRTAHFSRGHWVRS